MKADINFNAMDVVKFFSAILLVCAHTASERVSLPKFLDLCCSLYIVTVPFFFVASSFLFFKKLDTQSCDKRIQSFEKYTYRIWSLYVVWSLIYFCFVVTNWLINSCGVDDVLFYLHHSLVFSTYPTIWFLPALWIGVGLVYLCKYKCQMKDRDIFLIAMALYCIGGFFYSYHSICSETESINATYTRIFVTWRNGLFYAFVYAFIGYKIAVSEFISRKSCLLGTVLFCVLFLAEAFGMKSIVPTSDANFLFMLVPFSYFFFSLVCKIKLQDSTIYLSLRKMSMLIFVSQRLFLTAIPSVVVSTFPSGPWDITDNGIIAMLLVVFEVCLFSFFVLIVAKRINLLRYLM